MILSGLVMLAPAYLSFKVSNIQVQISTLSGVSTALLGILLINIWSFSMPIEAELRSVIVPQRPPPACQARCASATLNGSRTSPCTADSPNITGTDVF